jgi:hypothetical protein
MKYSAGFIYKVEIKKYSAKEIADDVALWTDEQVRAAFVAVAAVNYPENWPEEKEKIENEFKEEGVDVSSRLHTPAPLSRGE